MYGIRAYLDCVYVQNLSSIAPVFSSVRSSIRINHYIRMLFLYIDFNMSFEYIFSLQN